MPIGNLRGRGDRATGLSAPDDSQNRAEVAEVVKRCLQGGVPSRAEENAFMRSHARGTSVDSPILVGHTVPRQMEFPGTVEYSPSGYRY
jgi:hypothetical protein